MPEAWLTYRQLAKHWNTSPEAARARARRGNYQRRTNNVGAIEVRVDTDAPIPEARQRAQGGQTRGNVPPYMPSRETPPATLEMALKAIQEHVVTLKAEIIKTETLAEQFRKDRDAERERVADLTSQLLRTTKELVDAQSTSSQPRSWWRKLVG